MRRCPQFGFLPGKVPCFFWSKFSPEEQNYSRSEIVLADYYETLCVRIPNIVLLARDFHPDIEAIAVQMKVNLQ